MYESVDLKTDSRFVTKRALRRKHPEVLKKPTTNDYKFLIKLQASIAFNKSKEALPNEAAKEPESPAIYTAQNN